MKKLLLSNWKDKKANELSNKIDLIQNNWDTECLSFQDDIHQVASDNMIEIPDTFNPGEYKV